MKNIIYIQSKEGEIFGPFNVLRFIDEGNWIQLGLLASNRLRKKHKILFQKAEEMGNGEVQLTLADGYKVKEK